MSLIVFLALFVAQFFYKILQLVGDRFGQDIPVGVAKSLANRLFLHSGRGLSPRLLAALWLR